MAYSISYASGNGSTNSFTLSFPSGFISREDVKCRVGSEVDGGGDPVYRAITWITDGLVTISGDPPPIGVNNVQFIRTVSAEELVHTYSDGVAIEADNIDASNLQPLMLIQEYLDGRHEVDVDADKDMADHKIINLAAGVSAHDAVRMDQLQGIETAAMNAAVATAAALAAEDYAVAASDSEIVATAAAVSAIGSRFGTSSTSNTIGTGSKTFTTQTGLGILSGTFVLISDSDTPANYMHGQVTSYSGTTLIVNVLYTGGSGTITAWNIAPSGVQGPGGTGSGTVNSGTTGQLAYYASNGNTVSGTTALPNGTTGTTQSTGDDTTKLATTEFVQQELEEQASSSYSTWTGLTFTFGSMTTQAHGFGAKPTDIALSLVCTTADAGYSIGDEVSIPSGGLTGGNYGVSAQYNATNIYLIWGSQGPVVINRSTYEAQHITQGSWTATIRAWK